MCKIQVEIKITLHNYLNKMGIKAVDNNLVVVLLCKNTYDFCISSEQLIYYLFPDKMHKSADTYPAMCCLYIN